MIESIQIIIMITHIDLLLCASVYSKDFTLPTWIYALCIARLSKCNNHCTGHLQIQYPMYKKSLKSNTRVWFIFQPKVQNLEDQDFSLGSRLKTKRRLRRAVLFFPPSLPSFSSLFFLLLFWPFPLATGPGSRLFQPTISGLHWPELHP